MFVWQGTNRKASEAVCQTGFAALHKLDDGYFCKGCYLTPNPEYGCRYSSGEFSECYDHIVVMGALCFGLAYPVDHINDYKPGKFFSKHKGKAMVVPHDAHIVAVEGEDWQAAMVPDRAPYLEVVVEDGAQIFPIAIVDFKPSNPVG